MTIVPLLLTLLEAPTSARVAVPPSPSPPAPPPTPNHLFIETDPSTFVFSGFSAHVRWRPAVSPRWAFGAGVYAMNLPSIYTKLAADNRGEGWSLRARLGTAVFIDRFFGDTADGAFVGIETGTQSLEASRAGGAARFTTVLLLPRIGYLYRPFASGLYLMPWFGAGMTTRLAGHTDVAGRDYVVFPFIAFATLHAGWRF
jgi:hypothetical protein